MEVELKSIGAQQVGSRSFLYRLSAQGFAFPSQGFYEEVKTGAFLSQVQEAVGGLPYTLEVKSPLGKGLPFQYEEFQPEYIALFEIGGPEGVAVPLYEGHYGGGRLRDMEEVLRLYNHFGLSYTGGFRPDHLQSELEFMHALTFSEAAALEKQQDAGMLRQVQLDFLQYHLKDLAGCVAEALSGRKAPFYPDLAQLLLAFIENEYSSLSS